MKSRLFAMTAASVFASMLGCSAAPGEDVAQLETTASELTTGPTQQRAAADLAFNLMRLAATKGGAVTPCYSNTILAAHRYAITTKNLDGTAAKNADGTAKQLLEFRSNDPLLGRGCVTDEMKAVLSLAQQDDGLAAFLVDGQNQAYKTNGSWFPSVDAIQALANFKMPGPFTTTVADVNAIGSHTVTVTSSPYDSNRAIKITMVETVKTYQGFSPLHKRQISNPAGTMPNSSDPNNWFTAPWAWGMGFTGTADKPWSPFWGASGNPYMIISVNGKQVTWDGYDWTTMYCGNGCTGTLEFDPAPYAEPGSLYGLNAKGTMAEIGKAPDLPFTIVSSPYASNEHKCDYGTLNSTLGRFANRKQSTSNGYTVTNWAWVKMDLVPNYKDANGVPWCR